MNRINDTKNFGKTVKYNLLQCNCQYIAQYITYGFIQPGCGEIIDPSNTYNGMYSKPNNSKELLVVFITLLYLHAI